jgi:hypothetical protein
MFFVESAANPKKENVILFWMELKEREAKSIIFPRSDRNNGKWDWRGFGTLSMTQSRHLGVALHSMFKLRTGGRGVNPFHHSSPSHPKYSIPASSS